MMHRRMARTGFAALMGVATLFLTPAYGLSGDHPMEDTLELRVLQTGFAGVTGTVYRIEPSGAFVAKTVINDGEGDVVRTGHLDLAEMTAITEHLKAADLEKLPARSETFTGINPALIDVRYGGVNRILSLPPGQANMSACQSVDNDALCRVLELSDSVVESVESSGN
jgi:hypothetical protein